MTVEPQGWGEIKEGLGAPIRKLMEARDGLSTIVRLASGEELLVGSLGWGRDYGDMWEHVTTYPPPPNQQPIHFFYLSEVESVRDAETGVVLISQTPRPGET